MIGIHKLKKFKNNLNIKLIRIKTKQVHMKLIFQKFLKKVTHNMKEVINHLSFLVLGNSKTFQAKLNLKKSQKSINKYNLR